MSSTKDLRGEWSKKKVYLCPGRVHRLCKYMEAPKRKPYAQK